MSDCSLYASPLFAPLQPWLTQLPESPDSDALLDLLAPWVCFNDNGQQIRFVPTPEDGLGYEQRIWENGQVATRPDNWHDFFNALVWLRFPASKRAINTCHRQATLPDDEVLGKVRGMVRDALTHFDECGIVVLSSQPELLDLLRIFQWKTLFVERRTEVLRDMRFVVFGHASYEQLLKPFRGVTAKAVLYEIDNDWLALPAEAQLVAVDQRLAADLSSGRYTRPRDFQPLPLLGIPGMTPENEMPAYYDDTWQFRPGRQAGK